MATLEVAPNHKRRRRVRALEKLDPGAGGVTLRRWASSFTKDFKVDKMGPAVPRHEGADLKSTTTPKKVFRFYEVLFYHVDADKNGTLELAEFQNALKHMVKPNEKGEPVVRSSPTARLERRQGRCTCRCRGSGAISARWLSVSLVLAVALVCSPA